MQIIQGTGDERTQTLSFEAHEVGEMLIRYVLEHRLAVLPSSIDMTTNWQIDVADANKNKIQLIVRDVT